MTEELREGPPKSTAPAEPVQGLVPAPALPVSDELRRAVEDAQSAAVEPSPSQGGGGVGAPPDSIGTVSPAPYVEPEVRPHLSAAPFEVGTHSGGEWRIAVDPRSARTDEVAIHSGLSESLALQDLRAVPLGSPAPAAPAWRPWRRNKAAVAPEVLSEPAAAPPLGEPMPPPAQARQRLTGRERRWVRRRRRVVFEEVLAWVLVPVILVACYWLLKFILAGMGTTPTALIENVKAAIQGFERR